MPYFLYCWLSVSKALAHKCKIEREQTKDSLLARMHEESKDEDTWDAPPPEWYAQMVGILFVLVMVGHLWYKRFKREMEKKNMEPRRTPYRSEPRRPPRASDADDYTEEYL